MEELNQFELDQTITIQENFTTIKTYLNSQLEELKNELNEKEAEAKELSQEPKETIETFKTFLEENKLSTVHAEELFKHRENPKKFSDLAVKDFNIRKMHPKLAFLGKKVGIPALITGASIGATIGAIMSSGAVGGTIALGVIPISGTPGLTHMATTMVGGVVGLAATPTVIGTKNLITRTYYKLKSKSAAKNLEDYNDTNDIENLKATRLMEKIMPNTAKKKKEAQKMEAKA